MENGRREERQRAIKTACENNGIMDAVKGDLSMGVAFVNR